MTNLSDIKDREFDWFAFDQDSSIALFSTAGRGFVSKVTIEKHRFHDELANQIETPNSGSPQVWDDICSYGLYVYDWDNSKRAYVLERTPTGNPNQSFVAVHRQMERFNGSFLNTPTIDNPGRFNNFVLTD